MRRICITLEQMRRAHGPECQHFQRNAVRRSGRDRSLARILSQGGAKYTTPTKLSTAGSVVGYSIRPQSREDPENGVGYCIRPRRTDRLPNPDSSALFSEQRIEVVADADLPPPSRPIDEFGAVR